MSALQIQKIIEQLGYTSKEAKVYLATLSLGECHVSDISNKLKIPLSSVQVTVDKLHKNGLLNFYVKNRYKYWVAESPDYLLKRLQQKEDIIRTAMPTLAALQKSSHEKTGVPAIKVYAGIDEIKNIFNDIIETKKHILGIIPNDMFFNFFEENSAFYDFMELRAQRFLRIRIVVPHTDAGKKLAHMTTDLADVRFLPEHIALQTASFIYDDKVIFIMFNKQQPTAVLIEDPGIRQTKTVLFEEVWAHSGNQSAIGTFEKGGLFRALVDSLPQPLLIANDAVEIEYVNTAWEKQFGYTLGEVTGESPRMLQSGETPQEMYTKMWEALSMGIPFQSDKIVDKKKNGDLFILLTTIFPVTLGGRTYYVQILDDITEKKRVDELRSTFLKAAENDPTASLKDVIKKLLDEPS